MTTGEKIQKLRTDLMLSQEQLAEKLGVSRQSVSKWEMDQAIPQADKLLLLSQLLGVSLDELMREDIPLKSAMAQASNDATSYRRHYFGTDGFRGEANVVLTSDQAYKVGRFLGWYYSSPLSGCTRVGYRPRIVIGKDTRRSSYMLEYAIVAGLTASGADVYMLHVTTTPSVSFVTHQDEFDCGIMITASHNPYTDNGIKVLNRYGEKLDDRTTDLIEHYLDGDMEAIGIETQDIPLATGESIGSIVDYASGRNRYVGYLITLASYSYKGLRIGLDCANGASWSIARNVFEALGAQTYVIGNTPNGLNINKDCGSTHIEALSRLVKEQHLDVGFAFDGDADRCLAVDERGEVVDGDKIMYILARRMKEFGSLKSNMVVTTIMSNSGLHNSFKKQGIKTMQTDVGDRYVYEAMTLGDYMLGGEQSGHIILRKYATTGDGILTAIMLTEALCASKGLFSALTEGVFLYPQEQKSVRVSDKQAALNNKAVKEEYAKINEEIGGNGRALLRASGTEPKIRIMLECETVEMCNSYIDRLYKVMKEEGLTEE